ncbi:MAG TPA: DUF433 domain-containing protein [Bryobacteraceae bacterium]|jgi:uncharacterized protein (DUF433 family)|nr:DUF433 domain-containing protein [Bryobacteraceae bacterium]
MTPEQKLELDEVVWVDPERMGGTPCFRNTRVPVQTLIDHWEGGSTIEEFLVDFPSVSRAQALKFIELAKERILECVSS